MQRHDFGHTLENTMFFFHESSHMLSISMFVPVDSYRTEKINRGFPNQGVPRFSGKVPDCFTDPLRTFLVGSLERPSERKGTSRTKRTHPTKIGNSNRGQTRQIGMDELMSGKMGDRFYPVPVPGRVALSL